MTKLFRVLKSDRSGASAAEYALIISLVGIAIIAGASARHQHQRPARRRRHCNRALTVIGRGADFRNADFNQHLVEKIVHAFKIGGSPASAAQVYTITGAAVIGGRHA